MTYDNLPSADKVIQAAEDIINNKHTANTVGESVTVRSSSTPYLSGERKNIPYLLFGPVKELTEEDMHDILQQLDFVIDSARQKFDSENSHVWEINSIMVYLREIHNVILNVWIVNAYAKDEQNRIIIRNQIIFMEEDADS